MSGNNLGPGEHGTSNLLPELDLDENEAASLRPALRVQGGGVSSNAPPPPPAAAMRPRDLMPVQANIELDMVTHVVVVRYHPTVRGVSCGTPPSAPDAAVENRTRAAKVASYGEVPGEIWRYGLYAYSVARRLQTLKAEVPQLRASAQRAAAAYEKAVVALGDRARTHILKAGANGDRQSLANMRTAAAPAGQKVVSSGGESGAASGAERANIELAFRVMDDQTTFGTEWDGYRKEIDELQRVAEERVRVADVHELAVGTYDKRAAIIGAVSYIGGSILLLLLIFSPVIARKL